MPFNNKTSFVTKTDTKISIFIGDSSINSVLTKVKYYLQSSSYQCLHGKWLRPSIPIPLEMPVHLNTINANKLRKLFV